PYSLLCLPLQFLGHSPLFLYVSTYISHSIDLQLLAISFLTGQEYQSSFLPFLFSSFLISWKGRTTTHHPTPDIDNLLIHGDPRTRAKITDVIRNYPDVFSGRVGRTRLIEHEILLKNQKPIALKPYPYPRAKQTTIDTMIRDMEQQGLVEQSTSPWAAPVVLAKKKNS
ncbi:Uncharacterized protein FWK35_00036636, partial [Aphis craccivora]